MFQLYYALAYMTWLQGIDLVSMCVFLFLCPILLTWYSKYVLVTIIPNIKKDPKRYFLTLLRDTFFEARETVQLIDHWKNIPECNKFYKNVVNNFTQGVSNDLQKLISSTSSVASMVSAAETETEIENENESEERFSESNTIDFLDLSSSEFRHIGQGLKSDSITTPPIYVQYPTNDEVEEESVIVDESENNTQVGDTEASEFEFGSWVDPQALPDHIRSPDMRMGLEGIVFN